MSSDLYASISLKMWWGTGEGLGGKERTAPDGHAPGNV